MSLAPAFKFITIFESESSCPEVLSAGQILRALTLFVFLAAAMALYSVSFWSSSIG
jgi:hypothetical protein